MSVTFELRIKHEKVTNVIIGDPDIAVNSEDTCNTRQSVVLSCDTVISSTALTATLHQRDTPKVSSSDCLMVTFEITGPSYHAYSVSV